MQANCSRPAHLGRAVRVSGLPGRFDYLGWGKRFEDIFEQDRHVRKTHLV